MTLNLPKKYLSYSSWSLWKKNKDQFRRKYYLNEQPFETVETIFGKKIARMLESDDSSLVNIPRYPISEKQIEVEINGVPVKGYLDTFDDIAFSFMEYKTGHANKLGVPPWDRVKVAKHDQLPFYSTLIKNKFGKVDNITYLHWLPTRWKVKTIEYMGHTLYADSRELELTGEVETFKRNIFQWERDLIDADILKVALEISEDYTAFIKTISSPGTVTMPVDNSLANKIQ